MAEGEVDRLLWAPESILTCPGTLLPLNNLEMPAASLVPQHLLRPPLKFACTHMSFFPWYREWYSYHFPELVKIVSDNYMYAKAAQYIKSRKDFSEDKLEGLEEIVMDSAKAKAIYDASKSSMGEWTDKWF